MPVDPHLAPYAAIARALVSDLTSEQQRQVFMTAIFEEFSERNLGELLADVFEVDRHLALGEAIEAHRRWRDTSEAAAMRDWLAGRGWNFDDDTPTGGPPA